jgi:hypothetical protein
MKIETITKTAITTISTSTIITGCKPVPVGVGVAVGKDTLPPPTPCGARVGSCPCVLVDPERTINVRQKILAIMVWLVDPLFWCFSYWRSQSSVYLFGSSASTILNLPYSSIPITRTRPFSVFSVTQTQSTPKEKC